MELEHRFATFPEYIASRESRAHGPDDGAPPYAHPVDGWILRALSATPVKNVLDKAMDTYISLAMGRFLAQSVAIDHRSFPELFSVLTECSEALNIPIPHAVTGSFDGQFNAFTAGTDDYSFVFITDTLLKYYTRDEAAFVIGHECGHIASKHMVYHTLVQAITGLALRMLGPLAFLVSQVAGVSLRAWSRRSEITCDRAGLICCGDIRVAERALIRLVTGFADAEKVDVDDYLRHYKEMSDFHGASAWREIFYTHPMIPKRIEGLRLFARSELYYDLTGRPRPAGVKLLAREELDRLTDHLVKP